MKNSNKLLLILTKVLDLKNVRLIVRHGMVSGGSALIEINLFYLLYSIFQLPLFMSHAMAFIGATSFGFLAHTFFTFKIKRINNQRAMKFLIQALFVMFIGYILLKLLINITESPVISKIGQLFLTFFINLLIGKFITFKA